MADVLMIMAIIIAIIEVLVLAILKMHFEEFFKKCMIITITKHRANVDLRSD